MVSIVNRWPDLDLEHLAGADRLERELDRRLVLPLRRARHGRLGRRGRDRRDRRRGRGVERRLHRVEPAHARRRGRRRVRPAVMLGCSTALAISTTAHSWWSTAARSVTSSMVSSGMPSSSTALSGMPLDVPHDVVGQVADEATGERRQAGQPRALQRPPAPRRAPRAGRPRSGSRRARRPSTPHGRRRHAARRRRSRRRTTSARTTRRLRRTPAGTCRDVRRPACGTRRPASRRRRTGCG